MHFIIEKIIPTDAVKVWVTAQQQSIVFRLPDVRSLINNSYVHMQCRS